MKGDTVVCGLSFTLCHSIKDCSRPQYPLSVPAMTTPTFNTVDDFLKNTNFPPCYGDLGVLRAHGGLIVLRVGENEEGDPQLVDLVQGQRIL